MFTEEYKKASKLNRYFKEYNSTTNTSHKISNTLENKTVITLLKLKLSPYVNFFLELGLNFCPSTTDFDKNKESIFICPLPQAEGIFFFEKYGGENSTTIATNDNED